MSKNYETKIETKTHTHLVNRTCDCCGKVSKTADWEAGYYAIKETEIRIEIRCKEGTQGQYGGSGEETQIDLCPKCFKEVLIPALKEKGVKVQEPQDWDW